jgi:hypothetical protein
MTNSVVNPPKRLISAIDPYNMHKIFDLVWLKSSSFVILSVMLSFLRSK